jgi:hypothetical protein
MLKFLLILIPPRLLLFVVFILMIDSTKDTVFYVQQRQRYRSCKGHTTKYPSFAQNTFQRSITHMTEIQGAMYTLEEY